MATLFSSRGGSTRPSAAAGWASDLKRAWGSYEWGAVTSPTIADTIVMCKLPKGAVIVGGYLQGDKIDSAVAGSNLLSINIGLDKAVVLQSGTTVTAASTSNALAAAWALGGGDTAAVTGYKPDTEVRNLPLGGLLLTEGPLLCTDETNAVVVVRASTLALTTGTLTLMVDYYMGQHS